MRGFLPGYRQRLLTFTHLLQARRGARAVLWGGQNAPGWELKITYTRVITTIVIVISPLWGRGCGSCRVSAAVRAEQRPQDGGGTAPALPPAGRPALRPGSSRGRSDGVGVSDRSLHPQQRPGGAGRRVQPHAGLRGRLPAPGYTSSRTSPSATPSWRACASGWARSPSSVRAAGCGALPLRRREPAPLPARSPLPDMHMMVAAPEQWVKPMAVAGANQYTFHLEATDNPGALIKDIRENGMKVGLAIKPGTTVEHLAPWANQIDMALVMTVEPGFGGQKFMEDMMPKVQWLRTQFPSLDIEVDGGVGPDTIHKCAEAGANMIVSGSAIMKSADPRSVINLLRNVCSEAAQKRSLDR
ncbi:ribulose-phosphate 3-epimerase isoform X2 [Agelaius tricolor]